MMVPFDSSAVQLLKSAAKPGDIDVLSAYARAWVAGSRRLDLERSFPALVPHFDDLRSDWERAQAFGTPLRTPAVLE